MAARSRWRRRVRPGATWRELGMNAPPVPGMSVLHCGICGVEIHRTLPNDPFPVHAPALWEDECERACRAHLEAVHPLRLRLWERLRWAWLVGGLGG